MLVSNFFFLFLPTKIYPNACCLSTAGTNLVSRTENLGALLSGILCLLLELIFIASSTILPKCTREDGNSWGSDFIFPCALDMLLMQEKIMLKCGRKRFKYQQIQLDLSRYGWVLSFHALKNTKTCFLDFTGCVRLEVTSGGHFIQSRCWSKAT